jgi:cytochrome c553
MRFRDGVIGSRYTAVAGWMVFVALFTGVLAAQAAEPGTPPGTPKDARDLLASYLHSAEHDSPRWKSLMADGKARGEFCTHCHGVDGISVIPLVPNLAGQNPYYLLDQIEKFADGRRQDYIMSPQAREMTKDDKALLVFYYTNMTPRAESADPDLARHGGDLYGQRCVACHAPDAHGGERFARLAGQNPAYLTRRLTGFQEAADRSKSPMTPIAKTLTDKDIAALTAYLSALP